MIRTIRGQVLYTGKDHLVIEVGGGVGLKVYVPDAVAAATSVDTAILLHTYLQVREDALNLYGLPTVEELAMFELLLGVNGVGPRVALATLGALAPDALRAAVANEEAGLLARVPGIGKRTAGKIVLELKDKMQLGDVLQAMPQAHSVDAEVIDALIALGYSVVEAQRAVQRLPKDATDVADRLRLALQQFNS
ncbi:MAG: Holliday junction branch migration protein RuvA [Litorilinea sp.]